MYAAEPPITIRHNTATRTQITTRFVEPRGRLSLLIMAMTLRSNGTSPTTLNLTLVNAPSHRNHFSVMGCNRPRITLGDGRVGIRRLASLLTRFSSQLIIHRGEETRPTWPSSRV